MGGRLAEVTNVVGAEPASDALPAKEYTVAFELHLG